MPDALRARLTPNLITIRPAGPRIPAPSPPILPGKILVWRMHSHFRGGGGAPPLRLTGFDWVTRLLARYPRALRKAMWHLRTEGLRETWAKFRTRSTLTRWDTRGGVFAAVGLVVVGPPEGPAPGAPVLCWSWQGPVDADVHLVAHAHDLGVQEAIPVATTDPEAVIGDPEIEAILIATRHDLHAPLAVAAVRAGKHVFVEKPLALTVEACDRVVAAVAEAGVLLTVGFNRRFAPLARQAKALVEGLRGPKTVLYRVNAGLLPAGHWLRDPGEGGGRLLGEGVHFFDFVRWLLGADPVGVHGTAAGRAAAEGPDPESVTSIVSFPDGSLATILYVSQGSPDLPKERVEVFGGGRAIVLDDFAALEVHGVPGRKGARLRVPDKGHVGILADFHGALRGTTALGVTAQDGRWATWCAEQAQGSLRGGTGSED